ncbi:hypothetical protein [Burkholderia ubonensis]|uniref:hypothetical protein n=1 Tax=Burkholderia ubonensis TaxID=101571 RepID=UPI000B19F113|nr:hypothetical protein [Burkholderia ubonensis]
MSYSDDDVLELMRKHPSEMNFRGDCFEIFDIALKEFGAFSRGEWSLKNYEVSVDVGCGGEVVVVSFVPDVAYSVNGVPFEIASQGMYKNGRGVVYAYSISEKKLLKTIYMR